MNVEMSGAREVDLFSGMSFPDFGHRVNRVEKLSKKTLLMERGKLPIFEHNVDAITARLGD